MKISIKQLKEVIKEQLEEQSDDDDMFEAYPVEMQPLLKTLYAKKMLAWSSDAGAGSSGLGFYVPNRALISLIKMLGIPRDQQSFKK